MNNKKTILIFNGHYLPAKNYGGPVTSVYNLIENCYKDFNFRLIVLDHDFGIAERYNNISNGWNTVGHAQVLYMPDKAFTQKNMQKWILETRADLVYFSGLYSFRCVKGIRAAKHLKIPVLIPPRGELCDKAVEYKGYKKKPFLWLNRLSGLYSGTYFHATSDAEVVGIKKYLKVPQEQIFLLGNLSKPFFEGKVNKKEAGTLHAVYIARISETKNLLHAVQALNQTSSTIYYDIYGTIEDIKYWERCQAEMKKSPDNVHYSYKGVLDPSLVCETFNQYDCSICPTLTENYGHSLVEAMISSCPIIIPQGTTPWDDLDGQAGYVTDISNLNNTIQAIETIARMNAEEYELLLDSTKKYIHEKIRIDEIRNKYIVMFHSVMESRKQ